MRRYPTEFVYQLASLLISIILVHAIYVAVVRPRAEAVLAEQAAAIQEDPSHVQERSVWVIVRDFEQEACFVLMLWAMAIMTYKGLLTGRERQILDLDLVPLSDGCGFSRKTREQLYRQNSRGINNCRTFP